MLVIVWAVNFGISWWNARCCGKAWVETKHIGGWQRFMNWMGAIMSASGFTWCYLFLLVLLAYHFQPSYLKPGQAPIITGNTVSAAISLGYLILLPGFLFSGLMIWLDSLVNAWRQRDLPSIGRAAWNTYAQIHNTYSAYSGVSGAMSSLKKFFAGDSKDSKNGGGLIVILLVALALLGGVLTTWGIISHYAATEPLPARMPEPQPA